MISRICRRKNKKWQEFVFEQLFEIDSTSSGIDRNKLINKKGLIPYLTRSDKYNGLDSFICEQSDKYKTDDGNVITVGLDTQTVFYQPSKFYTGQNVQVLKCENLNKENAQFLIPLIKRQMEKFNWGGNGATLTRLRRSKLLLPINKKGEPDFDFMEAFMKQREQEKFQEYNNYISKRIKALKDFKTVEPIEEKEWAEFFLKDIFKEIQRGKRLKKADHQKGKMPYVSSTGSNNGVDGYVGNKEKVRIFSNCLTIANSGSVGACFYQPFKFVASDHVTKLKNDNFNEYTYKFISSLVSRLGIKYSFNREMNDTRIKKEKILLPTNDQNKPDYDYMENYMKQLEYKKLNEYLRKKEKLNANA